MVLSISNIFTTDDLNYILNLPEVLKSKILIDKKTSGVIYFNINLTISIKNSINEKLDLDLSNINTIPMRWIKGDTLKHLDIGDSPFADTYLIYLTNSLGDFVVDNQNYPITQNNAYIFNEGVDHETINTGSEPRLLLGAMSENGFPVGAGTFILATGGTTVYIKQEDNIIKYSYDNETFNDMYLPCVIENTNTSLGFLKIDFITDIIFNSIYNYFICNSSHIQFGSDTLLEDGTIREIIIDNVFDYPGIFVNPQYSNIYIFNLYVNAINSTLSDENGWIGSQFFGYTSTDNYIINCHSNGPIGNYGGGIVGSIVAYSGALTIIGCSSSGNTTLGGGGICGDAAGQNEGNIICQSCWSSGIINENGGGITGAAGGELNGTITITNCYSTGTIFGNKSGGIMGNNTGLSSGNIVINNCYSNGNINNNAGGIIGGLDNTDNNIDNIIITNCYTTGNINASNNAGGIVGIMVNSPVVNVYNSYVTGTTNDTKGYIFGNDDTIPVTCYSEAYNSGTGWNSTNANTVLTGVPATGYIGTIWISTTGGTGPYELKNMGYTPYDANNILGSPPNLVRTESLTVTKGTPSITGLKITDVFYAILEIVEDNIGITINADTGAINTTTSTASGTYTIYIYNTGSYNITILSLIVGDLPCLTEDTLVLTPNGYINIKQLCNGDNVITCDNRIVKIVNIYKSLIVGNDKSYPCIIPKNSISNNYPSETFKISQGHLIKHNKYWIYPKLYFKLDKSLKKIKYYHIKLENYITDNLVINNGIVVESLGNYPSDIPNIEYIREGKCRLKKTYLKFKPRLL
jgi:hypothetical protein